MICGICGFPFTAEKEWKKAKQIEKEISVKRKELLWVSYYFNTIFNIKEIK